MSAHAASCSADALSFFSWAAAFLSTAYGFALAPPFGCSSAAFSIFLD